MLIGIFLVSISYFLVYGYYVYIFNAKNRVQFYSLKGDCIFRMDLYIFYQFYIAIFFDKIIFSISVFK